MTLRLVLKHIRNNLMDKVVIRQNHKSCSKVKLSGPKISESSSSGSGSDHGSESEKSDAPAQSDSFPSKNSNHSTETKNRHKSDSSREWDENPDIYGIRRSARSRKEPDRLTIAQPDSDNDTRKKIKKPR